MWLEIILGYRGHTNTQIHKYTTKQHANLLRLNTKNKQKRESCT